MEEHHIDKSLMSVILDEMADDFKAATKIGTDIVLDGPFSNIVIGGMGGSALPGDILSNLLDLPVPILVVRDYEFPKCVSKRSLIFVISHSGNTEESIALYRSALKLTKNVIAISSGGKLEEITKKTDRLHIKVPAKTVPRLAYPYLTLPILNVLSASGLCDDCNTHYDETEKNLRKQEFKEMAKDLAKKLAGKTIILYASSKLASVAKKWKINFNENSNTHAFFNLFPEFNHNEINGFVNGPQDKHVLILRDDEEQPRIRKRMRLVKEILHDKNIGVTEMVVRGDSTLTKIFTSILIGDWVSYYLALEYSTDPTETPSLDIIKKGLSGP